MSYHVPGYDLPHGQSSQPYQYPPPSGPSFPGVQMPFAQPSFTQNHSLIPGLAFGNSSNQGAWNPPPPPLAEPKLVPAARYYQPIEMTKSRPAPAVAARDISRPVDGTAEEGEISEGQFDDLYEPGDSTVIHHTDGPDDYDPANPSWLNPPTTVQDTGRYMASTSNGTGKNGHGTDGFGHVGSSRSARDGSGSYSPYLSPREIQLSSNPSPPKHSTPSPSQQTLSASRGVQAKSSGPSVDSVDSAKQQAQAAVLRLWPLNVRFDDYVREGVDPLVLRSLFGDLGLDTSTNQSQGTPQTDATRDAVARTGATKHQPPKPQNTTSASATRDPTTISLADKKAEERKDRIARLWAAKATKAGPAQPSVSSGPIDPQPPAAAAQSGRTEKEIKLQQKMEALQKSREARAQKAASKNDALDPAKEPAPIQTAPDRNITTKSTSQPQKGAGVPSLVSPKTRSTSSPANTRKRPVAADFVDTVPAHASKRPFGQDRGDKFVIDVSEASEDEDVEMDMASGDEAAVLRSGPYIQQTTSFRDVPQLADGYGRRQQFSSPGAKSAATPPAGLAHMDKKIEEMKKKIALAEARKKLKMALSGNRKEAASILPTADASTGLNTPKPALRRVQSLDTPGIPDEPAALTTGRSSPVLPQPTSLRLPKLSDLSAEAKRERQDRYRSLSSSLPLVDGKLQAKVKKLHLLQTQISRLEREIAQESAEKQQMEAELDTLQPMMDAAEAEADANGTTESPDVSSDTNMGDQPHAMAEKPTTLARSPAAADEAGSEAPQERQAATSEPEESSSPVDAVELTNSETPNNQPAIETNSGDSSAAESDSEETGRETQEADATADATGAEIQDNVMQVDDVPASQDEDNDEVVDLTNRDTDESQQHSPEPPAVPGQISVGASDSRPDQYLNISRESRQGLKDGRPWGEKSDFKPYQTPFTIFRDFRYHPQFATQVSGGLRSLTYSNKIDPKLPVCPNQLEGRHCAKGADCEYQHFESMKLPDDQILLQLGGTKLEGAERSRFNGGLRELLHDLREKNVKDFARISQGIVDYHNRFSGDPSKILSLGNVSL